MKVLLYQMGKVGSTTLRGALEHIAPGNTHHCHRLVLPDRLADKRILADLDFEEDNVIVTMVREPIIRNVSAYYQNYRQDKLSHVEVYTDFLNRYPHWVPLTWFQLYMQGLLDWNIFDDPGEYHLWETGFNIYWKPKIPVLLIRCEDMNRCYKRAFEEFFQTEVDFELQYGNVTAHPEYQRLKRGFPLPEEYVNFVYQTEYSRYFYSPAELAKLREKWT